MFSNFFDWLKKKEKRKEKKNFEKADADNIGINAGVNIDVNAKVKTDGKIVKNLTTNISNDNVFKDSSTKENFIKENLTKNLIDARERLDSIREIYYATNIAGRIIKKVLDKGIANVQSKGITLGKNGLNDFGYLGNNIFVDFGKIYRVKGLKFMQKGVIIQSGVIEKVSDKGDRSWEINISIPEFFEVECCGDNDSVDNDKVDNDGRDNDRRDNDRRDNDRRDNRSNAKFKIVRWEERDIINEFKKEIENIMNCEYEQNFRIINKGICEFVDDEGLVRRIVREIIWEEFGWSRNDGNKNKINNKDLSDKVFFPKTGEWVDVKSKCEDINGEFIGKICKEIIEGVKNFGVGKERFGIENGELSSNNCGKDYRRLTVNFKVRKGEIWKRDSGDGMKKR